MGRPEAQIVLLTLRDFVQTYNSTFTTVPRDRASTVPAVPREVRASTVQIVS